MRNPQTLVDARSGRAGDAAADPGRGPRRRQSTGRRLAIRWGLVGSFAGLLGVSFGACTLTGEDFEPALVDRATLVPDASAPSVSTCALDSECPEGEVCRSGACVRPEPSDAGVAVPCVGTDCSVGSPLPLAPTCDDGAQNGDETGIDCGASCARGCPLGTTCGSDADCREGLFCAPDTSLCATVSCSDGVLNGAELLADCGGGDCAGCPEGTPCSEASDCESGVCTGGACAAPTCDDTLANQDEADVDCGGSCDRACGDGEGCLTDTDCGADSFCPPATLRCTAVSCADGIQNGAEVVTDCGGGSCAGCPNGAPCTADRDCESSSCTGGVCAAPTCNDRVANQDETDVDCGGRCAQNCPAGDGCADDDDCQTGVCRAAGCDDGLDRCCQAPSCNDNVRNGTETAVDCGNAACGPCPVGSTCTADAQCALAFCQQGQCRNPGSCTDGTQNGRETGVDCGGDRCTACDLEACALDTDCFNGNCDPTGICISCGDGVRNGTETSIDCGGADAACRRCNAGETCGSNDDCNGLLCIAGICG